MKTLLYRIEIIFFLSMQRNAFTYLTHWPWSDQSEITAFEVKVARLSAFIGLKSSGCTPHLSDWGSKGKWSNKPLLNIVERDYLQKLQEVAERISLERILLRSRISSNVLDDSILVITTC